MAAGVPDPFHTAEDEIVVDGPQDWALRNVIQWHCIDCQIDFFMKWPPACPKCGQSELNSAFVAERQRREQEYQRLSLLQEETRRRQAERRAELRREHAAYIKGWKKRLRKLKLAWPKDERVFDQLRYYMDREKQFVPLYKRYLYWEDQVGYQVAFKQAQWEIGQQIIRARKAGLTYKKIAELSQRSPERCAQLANKEKWYTKFYGEAFTKGRLLSPVEWWLKEPYLYECFNKITGTIYRGERKVKHMGRVPIWMRAGLKFKIEPSAEPIATPEAPPPRKRKSPKRPAGKRPQKPAQDKPKKSRRKRKPAKSGGRRARSLAR